MMAASAAARSVSAVRLGRWNRPGVAWTSGGPTKTAASRSAPRVHADLLRCHHRLPHRSVALWLRHDFVLGDRLRGAVDGACRFSALAHPRPLEEHKVLERRLSERRQSQLRAGWIVSAPLREVRALEMRRPANAGENVIYQGQVPHLLHRDTAELFVPGGDCGQLRREAFTRAFQAECGEEVTAPSMCSSSAASVRKKNNSSRFSISI